MEAFRSFQAGGGFVGWLAFVVGFTVRGLGIALVVSILDIVYDCRLWPLLQS